MRRYGGLSFLCIWLVLAFLSPAYAVCTPSGSTTTHLGLCKPAQGETGWAAAINGNWDIVDGKFGTGGTLAPSGGGTGLSSYAIGDLITATGTTTLSRLADVATGNVLLSGGVGTIPLWGKVGLTTHVTGILPTANGGTGIAYFTAAGPTATRVYTFPDAAATIARTDAAQTFTGTQTFSSTISGSISGNAATVTTNANLTGPITSVGNATAVASQTGTGSTFVMQTSPTLVTPALGTPASGVATNLTGLPLTTGVTGILPTANGGTGIAFFTAAGPTIARVYTFPDQNATILYSGGALGTPSSGTLTNATGLPLTTGVTGILPGANGGTGNGFFAVSGPATSLKTFTFPNASANVLTDNALVTVAQGGTGVNTFTTNGVLYGNSTTSILATAQGGTNTVLTANAGAPSFSTTPTIGRLTLTDVAVSGGATMFTGTPGAHTAVITEVIDYNYAAHTMTITGSYATQRFTVFAQPTISAATALTVTTAATVAIAGKPLTAGAGPAAITNPYALWVQADNVLFSGLILAGSTPTTLTDSSGKIVSAALNTVAVGQGGTGATTLASNGVLYGNGTSAVQALAVNSTATNKFLTQSSSNAPAWNTITAGDVPTLNQNTTGSAATLTTPRAIYGNNFDGSAALTQVIASTYGGTGNGFTKFSGPATTEKTFTLPNASATVLTDNAAVTVAQGGTGVATLTSNGVLYGNGTGTVLVTSQGGANTVLTANAGAPSFSGTPTITSATLTANTNQLTLGTTNTTTVTMASLTGARTFTLPDANSNPVQPVTCTSGQSVTAISSAGAITCAAVSSTVNWNSISNPASNQALTMGANTSTWTWNGTTGAGVNLVTLTDTASNTGTGHLLVVNTATSSAAKPLLFAAGGTSNGVEMSTAGVLAKAGTGSVLADNLAFGSDANGDIAVRGASAYGRVSMATKGTMLVGNGTTATTIGVGSNTQVLTADSTQATGVKWASPSTSPLTTKGDTWVYSTVDARLPVGSDGQKLVADSTQTTGQKWVSPVTYQATPADPAGAASTTGVMMGLAGSITPSTSGKVLVIISGQAANNYNSPIVTIGIRYGTGTAPTNGAAVTGTAIGAATSALSTNSPIPITISGIVTGLTVGTAYWLDTVMTTDSSSKGGLLQKVTISAVEL